MEGTLTTVSSDDEAMRRVARGDSAALAALFDRYKLALFRFLYHLTGERDAAEDLVGETFLRVYQARARYRVGMGFTPWLFAIARNLALGELRRRSVAQRARQRLALEAVVDPEVEWKSPRDETREQVRA
ncbi:MAG: sigma-70 family RNA polymerase sigma factor, partial [Fimbriimonas ginsengisoli]|nr:sigma-70 family RNA polymerase sigma factor [Fimbriimonas ginsengisoli]